MYLWEHLQDLFDDAAASFAPLVNRHAVRSKSYTNT